MQDYFIFIARTQRWGVSPVYPVQMAFIRRAHYAWLAIMYSMFVVDILACEEDETCGGVLADINLSNRYQLE